jgi:hypothetical protein
MAQEKYIFVFSFHHMSAAEIEVEGEMHFLQARECNVLNIIHWSRFTERKYYKQSLLIEQSV